MIKNDEDGRRGNSENVAASRLNQSAFVNISQRWWWSKMMKMAAEAVVKMLLPADLISRPLCTQCAHIPLSRPHRSLIWNKSVLLQWRHCYIEMYCAWFNGLMQCLIFWWNQQRQGYRNRPHFKDEKIHSITFFLSPINFQQFFTKASL